MLPVAFLLFYVLLFNIGDWHKKTQKLKERLMLQQRKNYFINLQAAKIK